MPFHRADNNAYTLDYLLSKPVKPKSLPAIEAPDTEIEQHDEGELGKEVEDVGMGQGSEVEVNEEWQGIDSGDDSSSSSSSDSE